MAGLGFEEGRAGAAFGGEGVWCDNWTQLIHYNKVT